MSLGMDKPLRWDKTSLDIILPKPDKLELNIDD
jgi:hypothetical protein